jgi:hypothetical protein
MVGCVAVDPHVGAAAPVREPDMPPVIIWALGALGAAVAIKWLAREMQRIKAVHREDAATVEVRRPEVRTLVQDPVTGVYRPK